MKPHVKTVEDGSILIEWIAPDRRFGLSFERVLSESSWFYVDKDGVFEGDRLPLFVLEALVIALGRGDA